MHRFGFLAPLLILLAACGGSSGSKVTNNAAGSGSPPGQAVPVPLGSGQTLTGINITVPAPAASPAPNAQFLGVCTSCSGASAFSTGAQIHQGTTATVILFGTGLSGNMQVKISGPADVTVSNIVGITASDGTPGVQFTAAVQSGAGLGGRTVLLISPQNDITTFTGGLEVVP